MNIVVPFTRLHPEVVDALPDARWVNVSSDDEAYWRLFRDLWAAKETVTIVEHDIVPTPTALDGMAECPEEWCAATYAFEGRLFYGLGCVKFAGSLMARFPDVMDRVGEMASASHPARNWCNLDDRIKFVLRGRARPSPHLHPEVRHLSTVRSHDCG